MTAALMRKNISGFTLIELLAVILIMATMAALVVPQFSRGVSGFRLHRAAREAAALLRQSRSNAIANMDDTSVRIDLRAQNIVVPATGQRFEPPGDVQIRLSADTDARPGGGYVIYFYPDGTSSGGALTLVADQRTQSISVDWLTGRIRVE